MIFHKPLLSLLDSKTKQKVGVFLLHHDALMSEREIAAAAGVSHMSINRIMRELAEFHVVHFVRTGKAHLWRVNRNSYAFLILSELLENFSHQKSSLGDLIRTIRENLPLSSIECLVLFGSVAGRTEHSDSDIDLYVQVNDDAGKRDIEPYLEKLNLFCLERYGNSLSPYILTEKEKNMKAGLKLLDKIRQGIKIHPQNNIHESRP